MNLKKKMSNKEELKETSRQLMHSIEDQFDDMRGNVERAGKIGLWVGGGLLSVLLLSQLFTSDKESEEEGVEPKKKKKKRKVQFSSKSSFLSDTLKEQAILFALGLAAKQLTTFLSELKKEDEAEDSK